MSFFHLKIFSGELDIKEYGKEAEISELNEISIKKSKKVVKEDLRNSSQLKKQTTSIPNPTPVKQDIMPIVKSEQDPTSALKVKKVLPLSSNSSIQPSQKRKADLIENTNQGIPDKKRKLVNLRIL